MEIHQLVAVAGYGDATTNDALALRRVFAELGPSHIFSVEPPDPRLPEVRRLDEYPSLPSAARGDNVLVLHFAIGEPRLLEFLNERPERLVLRYHNVTPPEHYEGFDPTFARQLAASREELAALRPRVDLAIAASHFSAGDLQALGFEKTAVAPLLLDLDGLRKLRPRVPAFGLPEPGMGPVITFVGRLAPNKGHPQLISAFHVLKTYLQPSAHLVLVGRADHVGYLLTLERFIGDLRLPDVTIAGHVSNQELAAVYRRSNAFLCLSEHEGFGVPLLEAMAFEVPVIAKAAAAVAETVDGGGIVLTEPGPALVAEAVNAVLEDAELRRRLVSAGRRRVAELRPEPIARRIRDLILGKAA